MQIITHRGSAIKHAQSQQSHSLLLPNPQHHRIPQPPDQADTDDSHYSHEFPNLFLYL